MKIDRWTNRNDSLLIFLKKPLRSLKGRVINEYNLPVEGALVSLKAISKIEPATTDIKGGFILSFVSDIHLDSTNVFFVDGLEIRREDVVFFEDNTFVSLKITTQRRGKVSNVMLYDENMRPVPNTVVMLNNQKYVTDKFGTFKLDKDGQDLVITDKSKFRIEKFEITALDYVDVDHYLYIHVNTHNSNTYLEEIDSTLLSYTEDFNYIFNKLELEKQILLEKSKQIRKELDVVIEKSKRKDLNEKQREDLQNYQTRLERTLVENELAYENTHEQSANVLARLRSFLLEKDSLHSVADKKAQKAETEKAEQMQVFKRNLTLISLIIVFLTMAAMAFYRISKKMTTQRNELEEKVQEINQKNDEMKAQAENLREINEEIKIKNDVLEQQKNVIETKNTHITASINYAYRIQRAMLPQEKSIRESLPDSMIFLCPRDIVSGDFYWFTTCQDVYGNLKMVLAAVDCTGHGVPGAFMSLVGDSLLNQIIKLKNILSPDEILSELNTGIRTSLRQDENTNRDGMDIAICVIDKQHRYLEFAGAKNPLVYITNNELEEVRGDKISIGGLQLKEYIFHKHLIKIEQATTFYMFSDGFQDQFGGESNTKYSRKNFHKLLHRIYKKPFDEQKRFLETHLYEWMRGNRQIDDVLVIGFRMV